MFAANSCNDGAVAFGSHFHTHCNLRLWSEVGPALGALRQRHAKAVAAGLAEAVSIHQAGAADATLRAPRTPAVEPRFEAVLHGVGTTGVLADEIGARAALTVAGRQALR